MPRSPAISFKLFQNSSSTLTLVLWPAMTIERFETGERARNPPAWCHRGFPAEAVSSSAVWSRVTCRGYRGIGNGAHNRDVRQNCYWRSLTLLALFYDAKLDVAAMT